MAPPPILSSPFLTHSVIDDLLSNSPSPQERIQLLSAKIHLYANTPSDPAAPSQSRSAHLSEPTTSTSSTGHDLVPATSPTRDEVIRPRRRAETGDEARIPEMRTRLDLAAVHLGEMYTTSDRAHAQQAEATLRIVLDWTKGVAKGIERRRRIAGASYGGVKGAETRSSGAVGEKGDEAYTGWENKVGGLRRRALEMMIRVEEGMGRAGRIDALKKQLAELGDMQQGG